MAIQPKSLEEFITKRKGSYEGSMIDVEGIPTPKAQPIAGAVDTLSNPDMQASPVQAAPLQSPDLSSLYESVQSQPSITEMEEQVEMGARSPAQSGDSNLWYFLPAALGALTGNIGEGSAASAGIIGDARKREQKIADDKTTLDKKIAEMRLKRQIEGGRSDRGLYQLRYMEDPETGNILSYNYNTATGETTPLNQAAGFAKSIQKNPLTEELEVISKGTGQSKQFQGAQRTTTQQIEPNSIKGIKVVKDFEKEVQKDPDYSKHAARVGAAKELGLYLRRNTKLDAQVIGPQITLLFEGPQRLTDEDVVRYRLPEGFDNRLSELIQKNLGKEGLTPEFRSELAGLLEDLAARAASEGQNVLSTKTQDFQSSYGFDPSEKLKNLYRPFQSQDLDKSLSGKRPVQLNIPKPVEKNLRGQEVKPQAKKSYKDMSIQELEELARQRGVK